MVFLRFRVVFVQLIPCVALVILNTLLFSAMKRFVVVVVVNHRSKLTWVVDEILTFGAGEVLEVLLDTIQTRLLR